MADGIELEIDVEHMAVTRALIQLAGATGRPLADIIRQNSRLIAVNLAYQTQPFGGDRSSKLVGEIAVRRDINRVYTTPQKIFLELKKANTQGKWTGEQMARGFYAYMKKGDYVRARRVLQKSGIRGNDLPIQEFDEGTAHQRRRNSRGRVGSRSPSMIVRDPRKLKRYKRDIEKRVGEAKGGWAHVARALGGTRGIPQFATRHTSRTNGSLTDRTGDSSEPYVVMTNSTPWIREVLNERQQLEALRIQREKMVTSVNTVLEKLSRKSDVWIQRTVA